MQRAITIGKILEIKIYIRLIIRWTKRSPVLAASQYEPKMFHVLHKQLIRPYNQDIIKK